MNLLSERLKWAMQQKSARDKYEVTPADLARAAKATDTAASYWLSDTTGISASKARMLGEYLGVNAYWLETGKGEPSLDANVHHIATKEAPQASVDMNMVMIVMAAIRDGDDVDREMLIDLARTINTRAALKRNRAADKS